MHYLTMLVLLITMIIVINGQSSSSRSCPEEYRELRRDDIDESSSESDDDQWREDLCEQVMNIPARQRNPIKSQLLIRNYCAYSDEALELARENNDTLCESKKRDINIKRQALQERELHKRFALRFIRKRLS